MTSMSADQPTPRPNDRHLDLPTDVPIVDDPAGLTPDWMTTVLRRGGHDVTVRRVDVTPVGTGQMGSSFRLTLDLDGDTGAVPHTLVAKLPTADRDARIAIAPSYRAEVTFYRELAHRVAVRAPRCHAAVVSEDATEFTLVLEDLSPAIQGDQLAGCRPNEVLAAALNLAGLHGPTWCDPTIRSFAGPLDAADVDTAAFLGEILAGAVVPFAERMGDAVTSDDIELLSACAAVTPSFLMGRPERFSLLHGDYRLDNLMFHPDGSVAAVDWQTLGVGLPARDLAYLIATSMSPEVRRSAEQSIVAAYHDRLVELAGPVIDPATTWEDYRYGLLQGPLIIVLGAAYGTSTPRGDAMFATMARRVCAAIGDLGTLALFP